ncbi:hypothetical protein KCP78_04205 [Salmonella enterica subsp. enterica]|nr:hypothetical protein KCP78_04205 [Salmonella enterica subsp. enterica]
MLVRDRFLTAGACAHRTHAGTDLQPGAALPSARDATARPLVMSDITDLSVIGALTLKNFRCATFASYWHRYPYWFAVRIGFASDPYKPISAKRPA